MTNNEKLVSIITPCYNSEKYLVATIDSVLQQTYQNWELLITDDGSTDASVAIIEKYINKDSRIKLFKISNGGAAVARNNSIKQAKGSYIAFLDSDDIWIPTKLEKQIRFMEINNYQLSCTLYSRMDEEGSDLHSISKKYSKISYLDMLKSNKIGCLTAIYNQETLGKVYMPLIKKRQDYGLWLRLLKDVDFAYEFPEVLAKYRIRKASISAKKTEMLKWNWKLFREIEKKSIFQSAYFVFCNIITKLKQN